MAKKPATVTARAGGFIDAASGGVVPPLQPSTTFVRDENYDLVVADNAYGRDNNDQVRLAEDILSNLEGAQDTLLFATGLSAIIALVGTLAHGDSLLMQSGIYWGTTQSVRGFCEKRNIHLLEADASNAKDFCETIRKEKPTISFIETPSNPWLRTSDIVKIAKSCKAAGALLAVDATAATPVLMQALSLGADIVMHSATKAINGHSDVLAGCLSTRDMAAPVWAALKAERGNSGAILSAYSAWMLIRGMRTLPLRVERMSANALAIAEFLTTHKAIEAVWYPGLKSDPDHAIAAQQMSGGFGCLLSFLVKGKKPQAMNFCRYLTGIHRATSLGGTESLIEHRHTIEGDLTGVPENLIRMSVGIEDVDDLISELDAALDRV